LKKPGRSDSPASDSPRNPELPTLNASSTSIPNRERRFGVIEVSATSIASEFGVRSPIGLFRWPGK